MPPQMRLPQVGAMHDVKGCELWSCGAVQAWGRLACSACALILAAGSSAHATMCARADALILAVVAAPCSSANPHHTSPHEDPEPFASDNPTCKVPAMLSILAVPCAMATYRGSQKYLPTFEPTLHQDFWLCVC